MEIKGAQEKTVKLIEERLKKKGLKSDVDLVMTHLVEEFGEIAFQINNGKLKRKEVDVNNIGEEISDCMMLLMMLAKHYNIDLEKALINKMEEVSKK